VSPTVSPTARRALLALALPAALSAGCADRIFGGRHLDCSGYERVAVAGESLSAYIYEGRDTLGSPRLPDADCDIGIYGDGDFTEGAGLEASGYEWTFLHALTPPPLTFEGEKRGELRLSWTDKAMSGSGNELEASDRYLSYSEGSAPSLDWREQGRSVTLTTDGDGYVTANNLDLDVLTVSSADWMELTDGSVGQLTLSTGDLTLGGVTFTDAVLQTGINEPSANIQDPGITLSEPFNSLSLTHADDDTITINVTRAAADFSSLEVSFLDGSLNLSLPPGSYSFETEGTSLGLSPNIQDDPTSPRRVILSSAGGAASVDLNLD